MEDESQKKVKRPSKAGKNTSLRVGKELRKRILAELMRLNKKDYGRRILINDYLGAAVEAMTQEQLIAIQEASLTHADRFEREYAEFNATGGTLSKDEYLGFRLKRS